MGLDTVAAGRNVPDEINVIVEIPKDSEPVKYVVDATTGAVFVNHVLSAPMRYPCNYGYVPQTDHGDSEPLDAMVILPLPLVVGSVIQCRPVGLLNTSNEHGTKERLLVIPIPSVFDAYAHIENIGQVSDHWLQRIGHFFEHFRDLEAGKWVKVERWDDADKARQAIVAAVDQYKAKSKAA